MRKAGIACSVIAVLAALFSVQPAYGQEGGCAEFTIYTAESVAALPGSSVDIDVAVNNTGTCAGETLVLAKVPDGWNATQFFTEILIPGETEISAISIGIPAGAKTSTVIFLGDSANQSSTEIIIEDSQQKTDNATQQENPAQEQNQTPAPESITMPIIVPAAQPINVTPAAEPKQQENAAPQAKEPEAVPTAGMITANPAFQATVIIILVAGGIYLVSGYRKAGFKYKYKN